MAIRLAEKVVKFLQDNPEQKFTAREIAEKISEKYPDDFREKLEHLGSLKALVNQLVGEISKQRDQIQKKEPKIKTTEGYRRKYYYTESSDSEEIEHAENEDALSAQETDNLVLKEHDLYLILSQFLWSEFNICSKRIDEKCSSNSHGSGGNKWLHPDLVGLENLSNDWSDEIKDCVKVYADKKAKLWSFEVKKLINRHNIREAFFQAVSNSSWANFGYLVASEIGGSTNTLKELRILSNLHGIGFIHLDAENPSIMIPAKERPDIDWNTANRLAEENEGFREYIDAVHYFYLKTKLRKSDWDIELD